MSALLPAYARGIGRKIRSRSAGKSVKIPVKHAKAVALQYIFNKQVVAIKKPGYSSLSFFPFFVVLLYSMGRQGFYRTIIPVFVFLRSSPAGRVRYRQNIF